ncbi:MULTISPECIES: hypothetical protein [Streptomyces]|uniref:hypothetical protein n=1 Tax=Streptomyces TaxID=1883 RepID=UPI000C273C46|nr:hypothetical protein [Streptomyces sp. CB02120-2]PJN19277.1 hypothetical protein CG724_11035 [Streptomyces sp. CB02120-2]
MSAPTAIPTTITLDQRRAVCRALGLPPALVFDVRLDARDGVHASLYVLDREGRRIHHGEQPLTATVRIPLAEEVTTRGTP